MALFKYFSPADALSSSDSLSITTIKEVNSKVLNNKKRGEYIKLSEEGKAIVGKYASEHGVVRAVQNFKTKNLKASSVSDWKRMYEMS